MESVVNFLGGLGINCGCDLDSRSSGGKINYVSNVVVQVPVGNTSDARCTYAGALGSAVARNRVSMA